MSVNKIVLRYYESTIANNIVKISIKMSVITITAIIILTYILTYSKTILSAIEPNSSKIE
jgi:hypothetical protein